MYGQDLNPYCYGLIESCADHLHWAGGPVDASRGGVAPHSENGGGHAHAGAMVYLGDNWPERWHGNRLHGQHPRQPAEHGRPRAPGFGLRQQPRPRSDVRQRSLVPAAGPVLWPRRRRLSSPTGTTPANATTTTRPIRAAGFTRSPMASRKRCTWTWRRKATMELVELQRHKNDWFARKPGRMLQERAVPSGIAPAAAPGAAQDAGRGHDSPALVCVPCGPCTPRACSAPRTCGVAGSQGRKRAGLGRPAAPGRPQGVAGGAGQARGAWPARPLAAGAAGPGSGLATAAAGPALGPRRGARWLTPRMRRTPTCP